MKKQPIELKGEISKLIVMIRDLNIPLSVMEKRTTQKIGKHIEDLKTLSSIMA